MKLKKESDNSKPQKSNESQTKNSEIAPVTKLSDLHIYKKKKLNKMLIEPENKNHLTELEALLTIKNKWGKSDVKKLFKLMYDHFEIAIVYGYQIENALFDYVDSEIDLTAIVVAALCFSRFIKRKTSNGTNSFIKFLIATLLDLARRYFDHLLLPSSINDIDLPYKESILKMKPLEISEQSIYPLINRLFFVIQSIQYVYEIRQESTENAKLPIGDFFPLIIGFISVNPSQINRADQSRLKDLRYFLNIAAWRLLSFFCCRLNLLDYVAIICDLIRQCLSDQIDDGNDDNRFMRLKYRIEIIDCLGILIDHQLRFCLPVASPLIPVIIRVVQSSDKTVAISCLKVLNRFARHYDDKSLKKCFDSMSIELKQMIDRISVIIDPTDVSLIDQLRLFTNFYTYNIHIEPKVEDDFEEFEIMEVDRESVELREEFGHDESVIEAVSEENVNEIETEIPEAICDNVDDDRLLVKSEDTYRSSPIKESIQQSSEDCDLEEILKSFVPV